MTDAQIDMQIAQLANQQPNTPVKAERLLEALRELQSSRQREQGLKLALETLKSERSQGNP